MNEDKPRALLPSLLLLGLVVSAVAWHRHGPSFLTSSSLEQFVRSAPISLAAAAREAEAAGHGRVVRADVTARQGSFSYAFVALDRAGPRWLRVDPVTRSIVLGAPADPESSLPAGGLSLAELVEAAERAGGGQAFWAQGAAFEDRRVFQIGLLADDGPSEVLIDPYTGLLLVVMPLGR